MFRFLEFSSLANHSRGIDFLNYRLFSSSRSAKIDFSDSYLQFVIKTTNNEDCSPSFRLEETVKMAANRKLLSEIQQVLKKIEEGVEIFDETIGKVYAAETQALKEKFESDLKKEIKKLQRLRDQVKTWLSSNDIKDKTQLAEAKRLIETKMESFKVCEKDTKTKAYSKEGLAREAKLDPKEAAREEKRQWLNDCLEQLTDLINTIELEKEKAQNAKGGKNKNKDTIEKFDNRMQKNKFHVQKIELVLRLLDSEELDPSDLDNIKDSLEYYIETAAEDDGALGVEHEFDLYEDLGLDQYTNPQHHEVSPRLGSHDAGEEGVAGGGAGAEGKSPEKGDGGQPASLVHTHHEPIVPSTASAGIAAGTTAPVTAKPAAVPVTHAPLPPPATAASSAAIASAAKTIKQGVNMASIVAANTGGQQQQQSQQQDKSPATLVTPPAAKAPSPAAPTVTAATTAHHPPGSGPTIAQVVSGNISHPSPLQPSQQQQEQPHPKPAVTAASVAAGTSVPAVAQQSPSVTLPTAVKSPPLANLPTATTTAGGPGLLGNPVGLHPTGLPANAIGLPVQPGAQQGHQQQHPNLLADELEKMQIRSQQQQLLQQQQQQQQQQQAAGQQKMTSPQQLPIQQQQQQQNPALQAALKGSPLKMPQQQSLAPGMNEQQQQQQNKPMGEVVSPSAMSGLGGLIGSTSSNTAASSVSGGGLQAGGGSTISPAGGPPAAAQLPPGFTPEMLQTIALLKSASQFMPEGEPDRTPTYVPRNYYNTHPSFPSAPLYSNNECTPLFDKLTWDTYFFSFYFQQGSYQQYLAAKKLKKGSWRFHKKYTTWFQRHNEPKIATKDYEEGTYLYFDFESGWCNRIKTEFKFEYAFLEDEVNV
jgi:CCR4-NOT transcription complex subunit 3